MWRFLENMRKRRHSPRIGLALSGGGARGIAHVGVLKVLERAGVPVHLLAGTSAGGLVGALYAAGLSAHEIEEEALQIFRPRKMMALLDRTLPRRGLLEGRKVMDHLAQWLGGLSFDQLRLPLALVAVDLNAKERVVLREGPVLEAVRATIALPGLFTPLERGGQLLVDGGLLDNLPVDVVRQMGADVVIGVDVATDEAAVAFFAEELQHRRFLPSGLVGTMEVLWRSLSVLMEMANRRCLEEGRPDLLIRPAIPPGVTVISGFTRTAEIIAAGELAAREALPELEKLVG